MRRLRCGTFLRADFRLRPAPFRAAAPLGEGELLLDRFHDAQRREGSDMAVGTQNGAGIPARDARCDVRPTILNERTSPRPRYLCWRIEQISWVVVNSASPRNRRVEMAR